MALSGKNRPLLFIPSIFFYKGLMEERVLTGLLPDNAERISLAGCMFTFVIFWELMNYIFWRYGHFESSLYSIIDTFKLAVRSLNLSLTNVACSCTCNWKAYIESSLECNFIYSYLLVLKIWDKKSFELNCLAFSIISVWLLRNEYLEFKYIGKFV